MLNFDEKISAFHARLIKFCWDPLTKSPPTVLSTWVKEFYAIMPIVSLEVSHLVIRIPGFDFPLNATSINEALKVPEFSNSEYD